MSQPYNTGPVHVWLGVGAVRPPLRPPDIMSPGEIEHRRQLGIETITPVSFTRRRAYVYMGTGIAAPDIVFVPQTVPWYSDDFGPSEPHDEFFVAESAIVSVNFTVWRESTYQAIMPRAHSVFSMMTTAGRFGAGGNSLYGDRGSAIIGEGIAYPLILRFQNMPKLWGSTVLDTGFVSGYRFFAAYLQAPDVLRPGTQPNERRLTWVCRNVHNRAVDKSALGDFQVDDVPAIPPRVA